MRFITMVLLVVCLSACAPRPFSPPAECVDNPSFILETAPDPAALDKGLLIVNLAALQTVEGYTAEDANHVLDQLEGLLDRTDATYLELITYILQKADIANALAGSMIFIVGDDLRALSSPLPVNICDIELIRRHLAKQRMLISLYAKE